MRLTEGCTEVDGVTYERGQVDYERLLDAFWEYYDPTTPNRQDPNVCTQLHSVIFYHGPGEENRRARV
ncbi:MAG: peptide-methionine (S)-S-oxide reductase [Sulfuricaulis sp.]